jgi:hypothetical protein
MYVKTIVLRTKALFVQNEINSMIYHGSTKKDNQKVTFYMS